MESVSLYRDKMGIAHLSPLTTYYIFDQIKMALEEEVTTQNGTFAQEGPEESIMREVRDVAYNLRQAIAALKQRAGSAVASFQSEVTNAHANFDKVDSVTQDLKEANKEVESLLSESGSNFGPDGARVVDENGVWVNPEHKKDA